MATGRAYSAELFILNPRLSEAKVISGLMASLLSRSHHRVLVPERAGIGSWTYVKPSTRAFRQFCAMCIGHVALRRIPDPRLELYSSDSGSGNSGGSIGIQLNLFLRMYEFPLFGTQHLLPAAKMSDWKCLIVHMLRWSSWPKIMAGQAPDKVQLAEPCRWRW